LLNHRDIRKEIKLIEEIKKGNFSQNFTQNYPFKFKRKFVKLIYNIYYVNLSKMQRDFLISFEDTKTQNANLQILEAFYEKNLKTTVEEVLNFFGIDISYRELDKKTYIQLYLQTLSPFHPERIKVERLVSYFSEFRYEIANGNQFSQLESVSPKDEIINFREILKSRIKLQKEN
jgi:hypothetical protein